eukprot:364538-Chlamydomonas_euryale.AAC.4
MQPTAAAPAVRPMRMRASVQPGVNLFALTGAPSAAVAGAAAPLAASRCVAAAAASAGSEAAAAQAAAQTER